MTWAELQSSQGAAFHELDHLLFRYTPSAKALDFRIDEALGIGQRQIKPFAADAASFKTLFEGLLNPFGYRTPRQPPEPMHPKLVEIGHLQCVKSFERIRGNAYLYRGFFFFHRHEIQAVKALLFDEIFKSERTDQISPSERRRLR